MCWDLPAARSQEHDMRKIVLMGRTGAGKTTLTQALRGERLVYKKTQYINFEGALIDTPGEYAETKRLGYALALYAYEADVVGLLCSSTEPFSLFPPCVTCMVNREVVGIVTKTDDPHGNPERAAGWLRLAGCKKIFFVSSYSGEGITDIFEYLKEPGDVLPWEQKSNKKQQNLTKTQKIIK